MRDLTHDLSPQESYLHQLFPNEPSDLFRQSRLNAEELGKAGISLTPTEARLMATLIQSHHCKKFVSTPPYFLLLFSNHISLPESY